MFTFYSLAIAIASQFLRIFIQLNFIATVWDDVPDDGYTIKRHIDHLLNHSDCKEPSVDNKLPLGPTLTQQTSSVVHSETSSNSTLQSNLSPSKWADQRSCQEDNIVISTYYSHQPVANYV